MQLLLSFDGTGQMCEEQAAGNDKWSIQEDHSLHMIYMESTNFRLNKEGPGSFLCHCTQTMKSSCGTGMCQIRCYY